MNGQIYQECPECHNGRETACCIDCECCAKHCTCEQEKNDRKQIAAVNKLAPGLLQRVGEHLEQGASEN